MIFSKKKAEQTLAETVTILAAEDTPTYSAFIESFRHSKRSFSPFMITNEKRTKRVNVASLLDE